VSFLEIVYPKEFFRSKIAKAASELSIDINAEVEFYTVNLMCDFINPDVNSIEGINLFETPLALIYKKAAESSPDAQIKIFKSLGDISIYTAGCFHEFFKSKTIGIDYYIGMGACAYQSIAGLLRAKGEKQFSDFYRGLSHETRHLVAILSEASRDFPVNKNVHLLTACERWHYTAGSFNIRRVIPLL